MNKHKVKVKNVELYEDTRSTREYNVKIQCKRCREKVNPKIEQIEN